MPPDLERRSSHPVELPETLTGAGRKWLILVAIGAGTFMSALDVSVVNTVLPIINKNFNSQVATVEWVVIVYLLLVSGLLPSFGRLGDLRGHKTIYIAGFFVFIFSSLLCGFSASVGALVGARALQALGAAMLSANSPAILSKSFPAHQRGQALGLQATMTYLGLTVGPSLGGWLTELISWQVVFFINLPVGLLALVLSWKFIPMDSGSDIKEPFDWPGALLFMAGLTSLLLGLNQGHNWGWLSPSIISLLLLAAICLALFTWREQVTQFPMLDLRLFRSRMFSASVISAVINYICVYSIIFLMPFYLLQGRGLSPSQAGLLLTTQPIVMAVVAPLSGTLSDRVGTLLPTTAGMSILAIGMFLLSRLGPESSYLSIMLCLTVTGLGIGIFISPNSSALLGSAPRRRQGIASALMATARNIGMVLGVGISGAIFTTLLAHSPDDPRSLYQAASVSFLVAAGFALAGVLSSSIRNKKSLPENQAIPSNKEYE